MMLTAEQVSEIIDSVRQKYLDHFEHNKLSAGEDIRQEYGRTADFITKVCSDIKTLVEKQEVLNTVNKPATWTTPEGYDPDKGIKEYNEIRKDRLGINPNPPDGKPPRTNFTPKPPETI